MVAEIRRVRYVLLLAPSDDAHALAVQRRLAAFSEVGIRSLIADTATFPFASTVEWETQGETASRFTAQVILRPGLPAGIGRKADPRRGAGPTIAFSLEDIVSVWRRRLRHVSVHPSIEVPEFRGYAAFTARAALNALFASCRLVNDPAVDRRLESKPFQLRIAAACGMPVPQTIVTTSPERARAFILGLERAGRRAIHKAIASNQESPPAREVGAAELDRLTSVELCPTMFQERVEGGPDLRIALVGDAVFAAEWRTQAGPTELVDVRLDHRCRMWRTTLSAGFEAHLRRLHKSFGLEIGVYDFKADGDGRPIFLEVNSSGQWLDLEVDAGHPVSQTVASLLVGATTQPPAARNPFTHQDLDQFLREAEPVSS